MGPNEEILHPVFTPPRALSVSPRSQHRNMSSPAIAEMKPLGVALTNSFHQINARRPGSSAELPGQLPQHPLATDFVSGRRWTLEERWNLPRLEKTVFDGSRHTWADTRNPESTQFFLCFGLVEPTTRPALWMSSPDFVHGSPTEANRMDNDPERPTPPMSAPRTSETRVLRLKEVCKVTGLGRSFIYQLQAEQQFPHSIKIGLRAVGWLEGEVRAWIEHRTRVSRHKS